MAQNAYLMRFSPDSIAQAWKAIIAKKPEGFDYRLYVDGDFSHIGDVIFWMSLLKNTPMVQAYGYSKSFAILLAYDTVNAGIWPKNYQLNMYNYH